MLRLDPAAQQPFWLTIRAAAGDDPAVRLQMRPIGLKAWRAAQRAAGEIARAAGKDDLTLEQVAEVGDGVSASLIKAGILAWEGVGDAAGNPVEPTPELIELLLEDPRDFQMLDELYVMPFIEREREKNASSPPSGGTSAKAMPGNATVSTRAPRKKAAAAKPARTRPAPRKRKTAS